MAFGIKRLLELEQSVQSMASAFITTYTILIFQVWRLTGSFPLGATFTGTDLEGANQSPTLRSFPSRRNATEHWPDWSCRWYGICCPEVKAWWQLALCGKSSYVAARAKRIADCCWQHCLAMRGKRSLRIAHHLQSVELSFDDYTPVQVFIDSYMTPNQSYLRAVRRWQTIVMMGVVSGINLNLMSLRLPNGLVTTGGYYFCT